MFLPNSLVTPSPGGGLRLSSTARVKRGPSQGARSASTEDIGGRPLSSLQACSSSLQGWGLIDLPLRAAFSPTRPLADIFHPPFPPIASQSISRDVPLARARASQFSLVLFKRSGRRCRHPRSCWGDIGKNLQHSGSNSGKASKVIAIWLLVTSYPFRLLCGDTIYSSYSHSRLHCERANLGQSVL